MKIFIVEDDKFYNKLIEHHLKLNPDFEINIDLPSQELSFNDGSMKYRFDINPFKSKCLQEGVDLLDAEFA